MTTATATTTETIEAMAGVFQKTARILSGKADLRIKIEGTVAPEGPPAHTDGETIYLNTSAIAATLDGADFDAALRALIGAGLHELGHVLFSPRSGSGLAALVEHEVIYGAHGEMAWSVYNGIEDARQEALVISRWRPARHYLTEMVGRMILGAPGQDFSTVYSLLAGRPYFPAPARQATRAAMVDAIGAEVVDTLDRLIGEYVRLTLPAGERRAIEIIRAICDLLSQDEATAERAGESADHGSMGEGEIDQDAQEAAADNLDDLLDELAEEAAEESADDDAGSESDGESTEGDDETAQDGPESPEGEATDDDATEGEDSAEGEGEGTDTDDGADGAAEGGTVPTQAEVREALAGAVEEAAGDDTVRAEIELAADAVNDALDNLGAADYAEGGEVGVTDAMVSDAALNTAEITADAFRTLRNALDAEWTEGERGRFAMGRYMTASPEEAMGFDFWDEWDEGAEDAASIEMVIALDSSGSMDPNQMTTATEGAYITKRSLEAIEGRATVLAFNSSPTPAVLYHPSDRTNEITRRDVHSGGGTNPRYAIDEARRIFARTDKAAKVLVILTDGRWAGNGRAGEAEIADARSEGVLTVLIGTTAPTSDWQRQNLDEPILGPVEEYGDHGCEIALDITGTERLPEVVDEIVAEIMRRKARR